MIEKKAPMFTNLSDFANSALGGQVAFATDDFFAPCENMIADSDPVFIADKYTEFGKWMDGWETRRKRISGHDWCILKLAVKCVIRGLLVDTAFFTGNYAPRYSIQAASLSDEEEALIPKRDSKMGTAASKRDLEKIERLKSDKWEEIVPITALRPGDEDTRLNFQKVLSDDAYTHIRVNMYPDGGIARLRVYGEAKVGSPPEGEVVDLLSLFSGAACQGYSNAHFGHPRNIIKPWKSESMADGWETARRLDRPDVIELNEDGTMNMTGHEWAVFKLGYPGAIEKVCVDTRHFKGNYPDSVRIEGAHLGYGDFDKDSNYRWINILERTTLSADKEHWLDCKAYNVTHIKVIIAPDGGISRLRAYGYSEPISKLKPT